MDNPGEILRLCRLCLVKDQVNIPIFEEQGDIRQIFLKISSCLPVKVSLEDKLPKRICDGCSNKLDLLYEFWNTSANAEKTLLSWLGQAGVKDADETISAVAQQIAKPAETHVKQEALDEGHASNQVHDSFGVQSFDEEAKDESEAPPPKRARRTAAVKAQINLTPESDEDDDMDSAEAMTKVEDESDESDGEDKDPSYGEIPGTSADDQAGPSGVGKDGVEAPLNVTKIVIVKEEDAEVEQVEESGVSSEWRNEEGFWPCSHCGKVLYRKRKLMEHIAHLHTKEYRFFCKVCGKGFYTKSRRCEHEYRTHLKPIKQPPKVKQDKFSCSICKTKFNCNSFLQDHMVRIHTKEFRYFCDLCGMGFYLKSRKVYHVKNYHEGKPPKTRTPRCNNTRAELLEKYRKQKLLIQQGKGAVRCPVEGCGKVVTSKGNLGVHLDSHENQKYICEYCSKIFTHYPSLERHIKTHINGTKTFECDICNKILTTSSNLLYHKRIHTGEKPAQCEHCGKGFTCVRDLNIHRKRHHQDLIAKYNCKICEKKFTIYGRLRQHYVKYHPDHEVEDEKDL